MHSLTYHLIAMALLASACSEFPCVANGARHTLDPTPFEFGDRVRYTYWFEDGAQRVVFDREQVPETARPAVLVHVDGKTTADLHGATGWAADISEPDRAEARFLPMAAPRARAYASWVGAWAGSWVSARADNLATTIEATQAMQAALVAADDPAQLAPIDSVPDLRDELRDEGISLDGLKLGRALRVVGARQPVPRDFGLSVDVHATWLFVDADCTACDEASRWLDERGIPHHSLLVSDPTNARTLRDLSKRAGIEKAAVPTLWRTETVMRGFDPGVWEQEIR